MGQTSRESPDERTRFNALGLACVAISIAHSMFLRAREAGAGRELSLQEKMICDHY
jgi:ornithine cyclodeaminase/alanine dehydrogenase-like protein (mu-crystallin family)